MPTVQVVLKSRLFAQEVRYVHYYNHATGGVPEVEYLCATLAGVYQTNLQTNLVDNYSMYGAEWKNLSVAGLPTLEADITAWSGTSTVLPVPSQIAAVVGYKANTAPPNTARNYIAGIPSSFLTDAGVWTTAFVSVLEGLAEDTLEIPIGVGSPERWIRQAVSLSPTTHLVTANNPVTIIRVTNVPGTQRRRRIGSGS